MTGQSNQHNARPLIQLQAYIRYFKIFTSFLTEGKRNMARDKSEKADIQVS